MKEILDRYKIKGILPYENRIFFIQHFYPYVFFSPYCNGKNILEIGVGHGFGSFHLSSYAKRVVALDMDWASIVNLRQYIDRDNVGNVSCVNANGISLPFKDASFDAILLCQVIEHIPEEFLLKFVGELKRVLKTGGNCLIVTLNIEHNIKKSVLYEKWYQHHKEFRADELRKLLSPVFPAVKIYGLNKKWYHCFILRLKRWGFDKWLPARLNFVKKFYENISCADYGIVNLPSRHSVDLYGMCSKGGICG